MKPVIGYTLGDQSGIGPEVISAALASGELPEDAEYRLIGKRVELPREGLMRNPPNTPSTIWNRRPMPCGKGRLTLLSPPPSARKPCMRQVSAGRGRRNSLQNA